MHNIDTFYLPRVSPADFESFKRLMKSEIAPTFEKWLESHKERISHYGQGSRVIEVDVDPNDFAEFCSRESKGHNAMALLDFAAMLGETKERQ